MKRILISPKIIKDKNGAICYSIEREWIYYAEKIGFNLTIYNSTIKDLTKFNGLILPGGNTLGKYSKLKVDKEREVIEKYLLNKFIKLKQTILGVCKGSQFIYDFYNQKVIRVMGHVKKNHVTYDQNRMKLNVNSFHNFGVYKKDLDNNFEIIWISKDDTVEFSKKINSPIYCMMFHPERINRDFKIVDKLFKKIFLI